jgi:FkbM family methyltransferase
MHRLDDSFLSRVRRAVGMVTLYEDPLTAYRHRAGKVRPGLVTHQLRGGPALTVDAGPADIRVINEVWIAGCYAFPRLIPRDGWRVIDLGANKGIYAAWVLQQADALVTCYEPDPGNYTCLVANVGRRVQHFNVAVGSSTGTVTLYQVPHSGALSSIVPGRLQRRGTDTIPVEVPLVSFAGVTQDVGRIDLLKIDVEGAEYDILLHSPDAAFASVQRIILEYDAVDPANAGITGRDLAARLRQLGFTINEGLDAAVKGNGARIMSAWR